VSAARVRGYLATADVAAREGRPVDAAAALRLAEAAAARLAPHAPERTELAVARAESAQRAGDREAAAAAFAQACALDRDAGRRDGVTVVRRLRAALAAEAAGDVPGARALADEAIALTNAGELRDQARAVRQRLDHPGLQPAHPATAGSGPSVPHAAPLDPTPGIGSAPVRVEDLLAELDALVGLANVKEEVRRLAALAKVAKARAAAGMPTGERTRHLAMVGAPGTGKTTVARLLGRIYATLGIVGEGQLVEVTRADLVAGYVGQTAQKTNAACDQALGGVLFVDEAYSLVAGGDQDFGREALAELVKRMEDDRGRLVVILAGYPLEMEQMIAANTGLRSRLQATLTFLDYTAGELAAIFDTIAQRDGWRLTDAARERAHATLAAMHGARGPDWANARSARTFFEECLAHQALRVTADGTVTADELDLLEAADVPDTSA